MNSWLLSSLSILICLTATPSFSEERPAPHIKSAFSLRFENDSFGDTDENYTNGMSLALALTGGGVLGGVWNLFDAPEGRRFATYELGQLIFTPSNLNLPDPDPLDRPYAGFLYLGISTYLQHEESLHGLKLFAGVVGPASLAEAVQRATHRLIGSTLPKGWDYQLRNEPVVNLLYEYRRKISLTSRDAAVGVELIPMGGAMLGNFLIQAQTEMQVRIGYQLPNDFGTTTLRGIGFLPFPQDDVSHRAWGFYAFAGGYASVVGRNLTLDGNTFMHSRSVDKRPFLPALEFGASLWTRYFQTSFSYVMLGNEFYGQPRREDIGSVLLSSYF